MLMGGSSGLPATSCHGHCQQLDGHLLWSCFWTPGASLFGVFKEPGLLPAQLFCLLTGSPESARSVVLEHYAHTPYQEGRECKDGTSQFAPRKCQWNEGIQ